MLEGWRRPSCGSVYAPWVGKCGICPVTISVSTTAALPTCPSCGKAPCDGSQTGCPLPARPGIWASF